VSEPAPFATAVPTLAEIQADLCLLDHLPVGVLITLRRQARYLEADLSAAVERRMAQSGRQCADAEPSDDWISLDEAADLVRRPRSWLLRRHPRPAWLKRLGRKTFVVSRLGLQRWLDSRPS
jgi:hypothetical protein